MRTKSEVAKIMGISTAQVERIEKDALRKLRVILSEVFRDPPSHHESNRSCRRGRKCTT